MKVIFSFASRILLVVLGGTVGSVAWAQTSPIEWLLRAPTLLAGHKAAQMATDWGESFLGFHALRSGEEAQVGVYRISGPEELTQVAYDCRVKMAGNDRAEGVECGASGEATQFSHLSRGRAFSPEEYRQSLDEAIRVFDQRIGKPVIIHAAKVWRAENSLHFALTWRRGVTDPARTTYVLCHLHDGRIDCHRQSRPGPGEPAI